MTPAMTLPEPPATETTGAELTTHLILAEEPFLRRLALKYVRQSSDADDLVQETMLRAYKARHAFVPGTSIRAWLLTILRRLFLTNVRTERRRATRLNSDCEDALSRVIDEHDDVGSPDTAEKPILRLDRVDSDVRRAFERLPNDSRELLMLVALEGLSYREIAARLSIPVGTVMSRIHRARTRILSCVDNRKVA